MIVSFFSVEKKYFKNFYFPVIFLFFLYFPFITGINSARPDYNAYVNIFHELPELFSPGFFSESRASHTELGYNIFTGVIRLFTNSPTIFFILLCFFSFVFRFNAIKHFVHKEDVVLVLFAFFAHEYLRKDAIQIRNGIASAIILFSFISLYKGHRLRFCIWVIMASLFHMVALIALPLVIVINNSSLCKKSLHVMQGALIIAVVSTFFFSITDVLLVFEGLGILPRQITTYLHWYRYNRPLPIYHPVVLKQVILCSLFLFIKNDILFFSNRKAIFLFKIYFISTLYYLVFLDFEILAGRFGSLFHGVETLFLLQIINTDAVKQKQLMKLAVFVLICSSFIMNWITFSSVLSFEMTFQ